MELKERKIVVYDLETNGFLDHDGVQPIEIAAIVIYPDGRAEEHNEFVKCPIPISEKITQITSITQEQVDGGIEIEEMTDIMTEILTDGFPIIAGHNIIQFDNLLIQRFLDNRKKRIYGQQCFDTAGEFKSKLIGWKRFPDATHFSFHKAVLQARRRGIRFNLTEACKDYKIEMEGPAHRAIVDVRNNLQLLIRQFEDLELDVPHLYKLKK